MTLLKRLASVFFVITILISMTFSAFGFVVQKIQFIGLQRITHDTAIHYLPIHVGQDYNAAVGQKIIQALYSTDFFKSISLRRQGSTLIVDVQERPVIGLINILGAKAIPVDKLRTVLSKIGIVEGDSYDPTKLKQIEEGLEQQYGTMGYYATSVATKVKRKPRNRVALYITINEGPIAVVGRITFKGNTHFSASTLRRQMKLTTPGLFTFISHTDRYSKQKLQRDLQALSQFYLNHGYIRFQVVSHRVQWSKDEKKVFITITVNPGNQFRVSGFEVRGQTFGYKKQLMDLIKIPKDSVFSRAKIIATNKVIGDFLADRGYAFAVSSIKTRIDTQKSQLFIIFNISAGDEVYVRQIHFTGNAHTNQSVMRHRLLQYEGSAYSLAKLEESKRRLLLLPYLTNVTYSIKPVSETPDEVDVTYNMKEVPAGRASVQGGYSDLQGFTYGASISEPNFMGTGKAVAVGFQNSEYSNYYHVSYNNPFYTTYGLSRGFGIYYSHIKPNPKFNFSSYVSDGYGVNVNYGYPVSENNLISFGYGFEHVAISQISPSIAAPSVLSFLGINDYGTADNTRGRNYDLFNLVGSWNYIGIDRAIFPTRGLTAGISLSLSPPVLSNSYGYGIVSGSASYYVPVGAGFVVDALSKVAYGRGLNHDGYLPFFKNFYSGGIGKVPAFAPNSLGPKNRYNSDGAIGGNLKVEMGLHLILPPFISSKVRTAIVLDAGNVFQVPRWPADIAVPSRTPPNDNYPTDQPQVIHDYTASLRNLRTSLGISLVWITPFAPIDLSLAFPLEKRPGDQLQAFQFTFGASL